MTTTPGRVVGGQSTSTSPGPTASGSSTGRSSTWFVTEGAINRVRARGARVARRLRARSKASDARVTADVHPSGKRAARRLEPRGQLVETLQRGEPLADAVVKEVHTLVAAGEAGRAQAIAESLLRHEATTALGRVAAGIVAHERGYVALAWSQLQGLPSITWARFAAAPYVRSGLAVAPEEAL